MDARRWERLQQLFLDARDSPPGARERLIDSVAADDPELASELRSLLDADGHDGLLDRPGPPSVAGLLDDSLPERIGPYIVTGELGRGGMGVVCRAHDPRLRRDIAIKLLPHARVHDAAARDRFIAEARAASALDHPHICTIYDTGTLEDGRIYIAMALYGRGTLADRLAAGPLGVDEAVTIALQVADALEAAHAAGVVHRDVKPRNIAFGERGEARLLDFGVALLGADPDASGSDTGGTPAYMAPEQVRGERVDGRADVWALGVVLFEMLTGRRPFAGADREAVMHAILHEAPPDVRVLNPKVPRAVAAVTASALRGDPGRRPATMRAFARALRSAASASRRGSRLVRRVVPALLVLVVIAAALMRERGIDDPVATSLDADAVVVLPFRVSGDPSLAYLREGMQDLLAARLTGEAGPRAIDARTVASGWRSTFGERTEDLPADTAVWFARRMGAGRVLFGDIVGSAGGLIMNAALLDAGGRTLSRAEVQGAHDSLTDLVDRLVGQLLSLSAGEDPQRLAALTSTSLPALRAYLEGQAAYRSGRYEDALLQFSQALQHDSTFALAGVGLGLAGGWVGGGGDMRTRGFDIAWRHRDRLSERDRALLTAHVGPSYPRPSTALQLLRATERALGASPDRAELWYELGDLRFHFGRVLDFEDWQRQAEGAFRRVLELDPHYAPALHHLVALYAMQERHDDLRIAARTYLARDSTGPTADYIRWRLAVAGRPTAAESAFDAMDVETLGWIAMNSFDDGVAVEHGFRAAEILASTTGTNMQQVVWRMSLYGLALASGRTALAARTAETLRGVHPGRNFVDRLLILGALYGDGDMAAAEGAAAALTRNARDPLDHCVLEHWWLLSDRVRTTPGTTPPDAGEPSGAPLQYAICHAVMQALREVRRTGDAGPAVAALDSLLRSGPMTAPPLDGHTGYPDIVLARLFEQTGDVQRALRAVRRRLYFFGWQPYLAVSLREEARLAELAGDTAAAIRAWSHFISLNAGAEAPRHDRVDAARAALERLRRGG